MTVRKSLTPVSYDDRTDRMKLEDTLKALTKLLSSRGGDLITEDGYVASVDINCLLEVQEELESLFNREAEELTENPERLRWLIKNLNISDW